jgi:hypothetical protein
MFSWKSFLLGDDVVGHMSFQASEKESEEKAISDGCKITEPKKSVP